MAQYVIIGSNVNVYGLKQIRKTMTVGKLVDCLQGYDYNAKVVVYLEGNRYGVQYGAVTPDSLDEAEEYTEEEEREEYEQYKDKEE